MGRGTAEETGDALRVLAGVSMDPLTLDMMIIIVVVAKVFFAEVGVFEGVLVSGVTVAPSDEDVELVCSVGVGAKEADEKFPSGSGVGRHCSGGQLGWYLCPIWALFCGISLVTLEHECFPQAPMCCLLQGIHAT
jgi:hypothetical protein